MRFGPVPIDQAIGGIVAHAVRQGDLVLKKGVIVGPQQVALLRRHGLAEIVVALLDADDLPEDEAARRIADAAAGPASRPKSRRRAARTCSRPPLASC